MRERPMPSRWGESKEQRNARLAALPRKPHKPQYDKLDEEGRKHLAAKLGDEYNELRHLTIRQVADLTGYSAGVVGKWLQDGKMKFFQIEDTCQRRISVAELKRFLLEGETHYKTDKE